MGEIPESEYMTLGEARDYLGVSKRKIAQLVERGTLPAEENPLDARSKIVRRADVAALKRKVPNGPARKGAALISPGGPGPEPMIEAPIDPL